MDEALRLPPPSSWHERKTRKALIMLGALVACLAVAVIYWKYAGQVETSQSAMVEGRTISMPAPVSGKVAGVAVREGQVVRQGEALLQMDEAPLRATLAECRAALEIARQGGVPSAGSSPASREAVDIASRQAEQSRGEETAAQKFLEHWTAEHAKTMLILRAPGASAGQREQAVADEAKTRTQRDASRVSMEDASRRRAAADAELRRVRDAARMDRPGPQQVALWQARVAQAEQDMDAALMVAPMDARVAWLDAHVGSDVRRGDALVVLAPMPNLGKPGPLDDLWVTAAFSSRQMLGLRSGQPCTVELEDGQTLDGVVTTLLSGDSGGNVGNGGIARIALVNVPAEAVIYPGMVAKVEVRAK